MDNSTSKLAEYIDGYKVFGKLILRVVIFLSILVIIAVGMNRSINVYDEGLILTGASRVAAGAVPHRDFYANYGPGQYYVLALAFKIFGPSVLVERIWDLAIKAGVVCLAWAIASRMTGRAFAAAVTAASLLWLTSFGFPGYPLWPALFFSLVSTRVLLPLFDGRHSTGSLLFAGLSVGVTLLFRYDVGFFACAAESIVLIAFGFKSAADGRSRIRQIFRLLLPFWAGVAFIFIPLMASYAAAGVMPDFVFQIIAFPSSTYARTRSLPFPRISFDAGIPDFVAFIVYVPPLAVLAALAASLASSGRAPDGTRAQPDPQIWKLALLATLTAAFFLKGIVRVSPLHMSLSIIPAFIALGAAAERVLLGRRTIAMIVICVALLVAAVPSLVAAKRVAGQASKNLVALAQGLILAQPQRQGEIASGSCRPPVELERAPCLIVSSPMAQTLQFIHANTAPGETIFVGVGRHDKILENDVAFYFIADRPPATKWYQFDPGLQTNLPVQNQIIAELEKNAPRYIVLDTEWDNANEPNESAVSSGVTTLDEFITFNYTVVAEFNPYLVLKSKP